MKTLEDFQRDAREILRETDETQFYSTNEMRIATALRTAYFEGVTDGVERGTKILVEVSRELSARPRMI